MTDSNRPSTAVRPRFRAAIWTSATPS